MVKRTTPVEPALALSPMHAWHEANGARFVARDGWLVPSVYTSVEQERETALRVVGIVDVTSMAKLKFTEQMSDSLQSPENQSSIKENILDARIIVIGPHAEAILQQFTTVELSNNTFHNGTSLETNLAGVHAMLVRPRTAAVTRFLVSIGWDVGEYVWQTIINEAQQMAGTAMGLDTLDSLPT